MAITRATSTIGHEFPAIVTEGDANGESERRAASLWAYLAGCWAAIGLVSTVVWRNFTIDDAFIGWRHGKNLVDHGRYAFNPTGDPVEAATSPLYGFTAALPEALGIDVVLFFKIVSLAVIAGFAFLALRVRPADRTTRVLLFLGAVAGPVQAIHIWSGLETGLFVLLATTVGLIAMGRLDPSMSAVGAIGAALVLTRQEGLLFLLPMLWLVYAEGGTDVADPPRRSWRVAVAAIASARAAWLPPFLALVALTLFRLIAFGAIVPNTLTTKTTQGGLETLIRRSYDNASIFIPFVLVLVLMLHFIAGNDRRRYAILTLGVAVPGMALYLPSSLLMNYALRFQYQLLWPLALVGIAVIAARPLVRTSLAAAAAIIIVLPMTVNQAGGLADYYPRMTSAMLPLGQALAEAEDGPGLLVMADAGLVPYSSEWTLLDTFFLGTKSSVGQEGISEQIRTGDRVALALFAGGPQPADLWSSQERYAEVAQASDYRMVAVVQWRDEYWYHVWVSPELAEDRGLVEALEQAEAISIRDNTNRSLRDSIVPWYWSAS